MKEKKPKKPLDFNKIPTIFFRIHKIPESWLPYYCSNFVSLLIVVFYILLMCMPYTYFLKSTCTIKFSYLEMYFFLLNT